MMDRNKKQITLLWVPGQMGIPVNEQADEEAKAALDDVIQKNEECSPKDLVKWLKTGTTKIRK
jgi:ribonuclease HI